MDQTYYDINRLYARKDALVEDREETWDNLHEGWEVPDVEYYWSEAETPSEEPVELMGLAEMASRVEALRNRIKNLEE